MDVSSTLPCFCWNFFFKHFTSVHRTQDKQISAHRKMIAALGIPLFPPLLLYNEFKEEKKKQTHDLNPIYCKLAWFLVTNDVTFIWVWNTNMYHWHQFLQTLFQYPGNVIDGDYTGDWNTKITSIYKQVYGGLLLLPITLIHQLPSTYIQNAFLKGKKILRWR